MTDSAANAWEEALIADIREHDGRPTSGPLEGHPLLVMYSRGAKSGAERRCILTYSRDGDAYVVAGTASGAPNDPKWIANLRAHPEVSVEIGRRRFAARASIAEGEDRARLWDAHVKELPWFAAYEAQAGRPIPMVRLVATGGDAGDR